MGVKKSDYIEKVKQKLATAFKMVDMQSTSFYLGLKIQKDSQKNAETILTCLH